MPAHIVKMRPLLFVTSSKNGINTLHVDEPKERFKVNLYFVRYAVGKPYTTCQRTRKKVDSRGCFNTCFREVGIVKSLKSYSIHVGFQPLKRMISILCGTLFEMISNPVSLIPVVDLFAFMCIDRLCALIRTQPIVFMSQKKSIKSGK